MRPGQVVLLLVVGLLVMLSVVGLFSHGSFTPDVDGWRQRLFGGGGSALARVGASELKESPAGCAKAFVGSACRLDVAGGDRFLRRLELSTRDKVVVRFVPARTKDEVRTELDTSFDEKSLDLLIDSSGATLTLTCVAALPGKTPASCSVAVR